jgi:hypothetical protein
MDIFFLVSICGTFQLHPAHLSVCDLGLLALLDFSVANRLRRDATLMPQTAFYISYCPWDFEILRGGFIKTGRRITCDLDVEV